MQHITTFSLAIALLTVLQSRLPAVSAQDQPRPCYFPNGSPATDYVACNNAATGHSACCRNNNQTACFATGLCYIGRGFIERGACTDQSWQSDSCPGPCRDFGASGQNILACSDVGNSFCCGTGSNPSCCTNRSTYFTFNVGDIAFINGEAVSRSRTTPLPSASTSSNATAVPEVVEKTPTGVIAGLAVGIAIPSLIAAAFAFMYFRERKKARRPHAPGNRTFDETTHYNGYNGGHHDPSEREGFMRGVWAPGGNGDGNTLGAVVPPKYIPPERRQETTQVQPRGAETQGTPVGELPAEGNRIEGLSELGGSDPTRYPNAS
ncbi:hypothetical protein H072_2441 [Dactylellina haptotyla CBS 200.50]|uniref:Mid2 domain-containing protein n=1 Tax=Dactylellina haptotyla (strain CBS 200.50) TaxID=1284197 RepID=S8BVU3_DACHA|nr:hypothetical protein H072_2441 [Dactylellina haptotyla CBS 200.50]